MSLELREQALDAVSPDLVAERLQPLLSPRELEVASWRLPGCRRPKWPDGFSSRSTR